jgi:hypothetical protein
MTIGSPSVFMSIFVLNLVPSITSWSSNGLLRYGSINRSVRGRNTSDEINLLEAVTGILNGISDPESRRVFRNWIEHVERDIQAGCVNVSESKKS